MPELAAAVTYAETMTGHSCALIRTAGGFEAGCCSAVIAPGAAWMFDRSSDGVEA